MGDVEDDDEHLFKVTDSCPSYIKSPLNSNTHLPNGAHDDERREAHVVNCNGRRIGQIGSHVYPLTH